MRSRLTYGSAGGEWSVEDKLIQDLEQELMRQERTLSLFTALSPFKALSYVVFTITGLAGALLFGCGALTPTVELRRDASLYLSDQEKIDWLSFQHDTLWVLSGDELLTWSGSETRPWRDRRSLPPGTVRALLVLPQNIEDQPQETARSSGGAPAQSAARIAASLEEERAAAFAIDDE